MTPTDRLRALKEMRIVLAAKRGATGREATHTELDRWAGTYERIAVVMRERAVELRAAPPPDALVATWPAAPDADHEALVAPPVAPAPPAPPPIEATAQLPLPKATRAPRAPKGETIVPKRRAPSQASPGPTKPQRTPEQVLAHRPLKPPGKTKAGWP